MTKNYIYFNDSRDVKNPKTVDALVILLLTMSDIPSLSRKMDSFSLCCYASLHLEKVSCEYPKLEGNALSSCNRMIDASGPRRSIWLLGILAVVGNLAVIAWRLIRRDDHPVQTCLLTNLAVADFLMGVYLMIIAIKDEIWAGI